MVLAFGKELPLGEGVLGMRFNGTLNDDMRGFYRRYYFFHLSFLTFLILLNHACKNVIICTK